MTRLWLSVMLLFVMLSLSLDACKTEKLKTTAPDPVLTLTATPSVGVGPLTVTLTSTCPTCVVYAWIFGDGTSVGGGASQTHVYQNAGTYYAVLAASDINGHGANAEVEITVNAASYADNRYCYAGDKPNFGPTDGPANLPSRCINTALANTPSPGKAISVNSGGSLSTALGNALCGDTILVQAGATFTGPIILPTKACDVGHWITVRTSASNSNLPPEGTRLTPCYAGVVSLPGRPTYPCAPVTHNVLAKIQIKSGHAVVVAQGANYIRLIGLEITRQSGTGESSALVSMTTADHIIFDRVWIHGTALDDTVRGIYLGDSTNVAVIDSYMNDFHCLANGSCTDAQTINGGNSLLPVGPYKIVDNFLEAAGENVLFGGAPGATIPMDIEVRRNHMFKPLTWMPGTTNFIGKSFVVKNIFEVKNAQRVLLEGNVMENSWGGFSQVGFAVLLTPRGSWAAANDITIRYNTISHVGAGFQIAATVADDGTGNDSLSAARISIHDVTVDDVNAATYNGSGFGFQISSAFLKNIPLNNLTINHVTMLTDPKHNLLIVGSNLQNPLRPPNIVFTNNIAVAGEFSVWSTGAPTLCAVSGQPLETFNKCWSAYTVKDNAIIAYSSTQGPWPSGNLFPANPAAVQFTNFNNGNGGNYQLLPTSAYKGLGADIVTLNTKIAGVQ